MADMASGSIVQQSTFAQPTPPNVASESVIWIDTSKDPNRPKIYDSQTEAWIPTNTTATIVSQTEPEGETGNIWFEPTGNNIVNIYYAQNGKWTFIDDYSAYLIANYENGSVAPYPPEWWTGAASGLTVQTNTVLSGDYTLQVSPNSYLNYNRGSPYTPSEVIWQYQGVSDDFSSTTFSLNGSLKIKLIFDTGNELVAGGTVVGTYADSTPYKVRLHDIDYSNNTFSLELSRLSDGQTVIDKAGLSFKIAGSDIDNFNVNIGGANNPFYLDNLRSKPNQ